MKLLIRLLNIYVILSQINGYPVCTESKLIQFDEFYFIDRSRHCCKINRTKIVSFNFRETNEYEYQQMLSLFFSADLDEGDMLFPDESVLTGVS